jgi:diguanylate cyclase (GGDEF)-like protein
MTENLEKAPMGAIINPYTRGSTPRGRDDLFAISQALQTTLSLRPLIDIFFTELTEVMPITGLEYLDVDGELIHRVGERARNTLNYRLNLRNENLGTIVFRRRAKFSNDDASELESMLCCLLYPLRNALLYQDALALAQKDALTGIGNRAAFNEALHHEVNLAKRHNHNLSMVIIDIDHFKRINDSYGHSRGDCAIQTVVEAVQECIRSTDSFFRYGGEEFVMLLRNTDQHGAHLLADRIRARVEKMLCICEDEKIEMTVSAGVSALRDNDTPGSLFDRTDGALYTAKRSGRNRVVSAD